MFEQPYGLLGRSFDDDDEVLGDKTNIPEGLGENYKDFIKKNFPDDYKKNYEGKFNMFEDKKLTDEAQNVLEENEAMIGDTFWKE